jgi:hypothetical protein
MSSASSSLARVRGEAIDPRIIPLLLAAAFIAGFTWNAGKSGTMSGRTFVISRERNPGFFRVAMAARYGAAVAAVGFAAALAVGWVRAAG